MRIVTWNCCRRPHAASVSALRGLNADIIALQEVGKPPAFESMLWNDMAIDHGFERHWVGRAKNQGVAVLAKNDLPMTPVQIPEGAPEFIVPYEVRGEHQFNLLNVWTHPKPSYVLYLSRALDLYADWIRSAPTIILGDFNSNTVFLKKSGAMTHNELVDRLALEFGLTSAYHEFHRARNGEEPHPTYYHRWKQAAPFHIDYCFVPQAWGGLMTSVEIGTFEDWQLMSDHRPLCVDVSI